MIFLFAALGPLFSAFLAVGFRALVLWRKKEAASLKDKNFYLVPAMNAGMGIALSMILGLVFHFCTGGMSGLNAFVLFAVVGLLFILFNPTHLFYPKKEKPSKRKIAFAAVLGLGLLIDLFGINHKAYASYGEEVSLPSSSLVSQAAIPAGDDLLIQNNSVIYVDAPAQKPRNIRLDFQKTRDCPITVTIQYSQNGSTYKAFRSFNMDGLNEDFHLLALPEEQAVSYMLSFRLDSSHYLQNGLGIILKGVRFNAKPRVYFGITRYAVYAAIVSLVFYSPKIMESLKKKREAGKAPYAILGALTVASVLIAAIVTLANQNGLFTPYPLDTRQLQSSDTDIFVALFDAFRKGQVHLDITPDPRLAALSNPYDPAARSAAHVNYLWDHAYYGGKYYSYYGALPVLLVSFPLYWLTGCTAVPNAFCLEILGMAMLIPAFLFLILEIYRSVRKQVSWMGYGLVAGIGLLTSMMIMAITFKDGGCHEAIYHVPDIYGLLFADLFFAFVLRAFRQKKGRTRELALAGASFVFMLASRPNLVLVLLLAAPFFVGMLVRKESTVKEKLIQFSPMAGILVVGAVLLCTYNKVRFDSILEFGQSYQLNVTDQRTLTYSAGKFYPSILHFFFQGQVYYDSFPFVSCSVVRYSFDDCPYIVGYAGAMLVPGFILAMFMAFVFWNEKWETRIFSLLFPITMILFAFTTYSKAGICPRYLIELYHLLTLGMIGFMLQVAKRIEKKPAYAPVMVGFGAIGLVSAFLCLNLSFDGFDGMNAADMNGFLLLCKSAFQSFNF